MDEEEHELMAFRLLAKSYPGLTATLAFQLLAGGDIMKVGHGDETQHSTAMPLRLFIPLRLP